MLLVLAVAFPITASAQSVSQGGRTLSASKVSGLNPAGEVVTVSGSGFDVEKGIYVAFCIVPAPGQMPTPCGGGADLAGTGGSSVWISSNPPSNGVGLAKPYGPDGTFSVQLQVGAVIDDSHDCREIACAIVTRRDHLSLFDRSQDVILPVSFAVPTPPPPPPPPTSGGGPQVTPAPASTATPTSTPTPTMTPTVASSPTATIVPSQISTDGLSVSAGSRKLSTSKANALSASGESVEVHGEGFDASQGIFVSLCAVPTAGKAPKPCLTGSAETSAWISSNPPDFGKDRAKAYGTGGSFDIQLMLKPVIDSSTDCRKVACAITTRNDDTNAADRGNDLFIPVSFSDAAASPTAVAPGTLPSIPAPTNDGGGNGPWLWIGIGLAVLVAAAGAVFLLGKRRKTAAIALSLLAVVGLVRGLWRGRFSEPHGDGKPAHRGWHKAESDPPGHGEVR